MSSSDYALAIIGAGIVGLILSTALAVLIFRLGLAPLRREISRVADEIRMQNEISLDDELARS